MKNQFELEVRPGGEVVGIYEDGLPEALGAEVKSISRASHVEWETIDGRSGWTVRAAHDPELALRVTDWCRWAPGREGTIITFATREEALKEEVKHIWELLPRATEPGTCHICKAKPGEPCDAGLHG